MNTFRRRIFLTSFALPAAVTIAGTRGLAASSAHGSHFAEEAGDSAMILQDEMRRLWEEHIVYTRNYIISFVADLPDQQAVAERLLENQVHIGSAISPYYGEEAGTQLAELLKVHILGAADLLAAVKSGDQVAIDEASAAWYGNSDDIAVFLNGANPDNWPLEDLQAMMKMHLDQTVAEAGARFAGDHAADIAAYDEIHTHILAMADALTAGIVAQFPDKFA